MSVFKEQEHYNTSFKWCFYWILLIQNSEFFIHNKQSPLGVQLYKIKSQFHKVTIVKRGFPTSNYIQVEMITECSPCSITGHFQLQTTVPWHEVWSGAWRGSKIILSLLRVRLDFQLWVKHLESSLGKNSSSMEHSTNIIIPGLELVRVVLSWNTVEKSIASY